MTIDELRRFLDTTFGQVATDFAIDAVTGDGIALRLLVAGRHLRPGGTVSGPSLFALADVAFYLALLSRIGPRALAVTTNCSIDFLRKPVASDVTGTARILKLGKRLAVGDVMLTQGEILVARASLTYAIPPQSVSGSEPVA